MEQIKIVHLCETLGKGGLENVIRDIVLSSNNERFSHHIICTREGGFTASYLKSKDIPVYILKKKFLKFIEMKMILNKITRNKEYAVLHCHGIFSVSSEAILAKFFFGIRGIVVHVHNIILDMSLRQKIKKIIINYIANKFIAVSGQVEKSLKENRFKKIITVKNATDLNKWKFFRTKDKGNLDFSEDTFIIGMIGRVVKRKGFDLFLEVISNIENVYGIIVGEGSYYKTVKTKIKEMGLDKKVKCFSFDSHPQKYYSILDALFLFSTQEGLPLVLLESQAVGVPFLGNEIGGIGEVVTDGFNGYLLKDKNIAVIREKIELIRNGSRQIRVNSRKTIDANFSLVDQIKKIEDTYLGIVKSD